MRADFLPGATVAIRADGADLRKYESDTTGSETAKTATSYVEAMPGSNFAVEIRLTSAFPFTKDHLSCSVYMDGHWVRGQVVELGRGGAVMRLDGAIEAVNARSTLRRFTFAEHDMSTCSFRGESKYC